MDEFTRREAMKTVAFGGLAASALVVLGNNAQGTQVPHTKKEKLMSTSPYMVKPLPFDPKKLNGISEKLMVSHWENNYGAAVKALNVVELKLLAMMNDATSAPFLYGPLKREQLIRRGSIVLHENYFANLGEEGKISGDIATTVDETFGSYTKWVEEFKKTALSLAGGSGWVVLAYDWHAKRLCNYWAWDHMHGAYMCAPLLVLDMYEHAFQMDYGAAAAQYIDAFLNNINWTEVNRRFAAARKFTP